MKRRFDRILFILPLLAITALQAGCTNDKSGNGETKPQAAEISVWTPLHLLAAPVLKSLNDLPMIREWQDRTQVRFLFRHPTGNTPSDINQQFSLMMASGQLPDTMVWNWSNVPGGPSKLYRDGTIIRLNDYIDRYAPNLKKLLDEYPDVAKQVMADNGDIYTIPHLRVGDYGRHKTFSGLIVRQDWLEELGLAAPETIDDWERVLTAFKEQKGAVPFTLNKDYPVSCCDFAGAFGTAGLGAGLYNGFYKDGNIVRFGPAEPSFRSYLTVMRRWYRLGLIDPDFAANDAKTMDSKIATGQAGAYYGYIGSSIGTLQPLLQQKVPNARLMAIPYPVRQKGESSSFAQTAWEYDQVGAVITTANPHPEETVRALDYLFGPEGSLLKNFGLEGETYTLRDGQPFYTDLILENQEKLPLGQAMARYFIANYSFPGLDDDRYIDQYYRLDTQKKSLQLLERQQDQARQTMLPPVSLTLEESKEFASIMREVNVFLSGMITKTVMGAVPMEAYDEAVKQLQTGMGMNRAIAIQQAALDRYQARTPANP